MGRVNVINGLIERGIDVNVNAENNIEVGRTQMHVATLVLSPKIQKYEYLFCVSQAIFCNTSEN